MKSNEKGIKGVGYMCCTPWTHHSYKGFRLTIGILMILLGFIWFGIRMGWIDVSWLQGIPFWPLIGIIVGICMVYRGLTTKKVIDSKNLKEV